MGLVVAHGHVVGIAQVGADDIHGRAHVPLHVEQVDAQRVGQALGGLAAVEHLQVHRRQSVQGSWLPMALTRQCLLPWRSASSHR